MLCCWKTWKEKSKALKNNNNLQKYPSLKANVGPALSVAAPSRSNLLPLMFSPRGIIKRFTLKSLQWTARSGATLAKEDSRRGEVRSGISYATAWKRSLGRWSFDTAIKKSSRWLFVPTAASPLPRHMTDGDWLSSRYLGETSRGTAFLVPMSLRQRRLFSEYLHFKKKFWNPNFDERFQRCTLMTICFVSGWDSLFWTGKLQTKETVSNSRIWNLDLNSPDGDRLLHQCIGSPAG